MTGTGERAGGGRKGMRRAENLGPGRARFPVRMPRELLAQVEAIAQGRGWTVNRLANDVLSAFVAQMQQAAGQVERDARG